MTNRTDLETAQIVFDAAEAASDAAYSAMRAAHNNGNSTEYAAAAAADIAAEEIYNDAEAALEAAKTA